MLSWSVSWLRCWQDIVRVRLIDTHDHVLSTYDRQIAIYATEQFQRQGIELVMGCRVRSCHTPCVHKNAVLPMHTSLLPPSLHQYWASSMRLFMALLPADGALMLLPDTVAAFKSAPVFACRYRCHQRILAAMLKSGQTACWDCGVGE